MHTTPYTAKGDDLIPARPAPLPLRSEAPDLPACAPPQKDIADTRGGKITDFMIYDVLGFGANSAASVGVTYFAMSKKGVKDFIEGVTVGAQKMFKNIAPERPVGRMVEILFMLISGTALTAAMAPLVNRRDRIAHWVNKKLGKDEDVLPEHLRIYEKPLTLEDRIEQELKKNVRYGETSRDLWKARWTSVLVPLIGDGLLAKGNTMLEDRGKWSTDSASWKLGQKMYDGFLKPETIRKAGNFFENHGAGIEDMRRPNKEGKISDSYKLLEKAELKHNAGTALNEDRMMIAEQTRMLGKEVGWTMILAQIVENRTRHYQIKRIRREEDKAIATMREQGIIPAGLSVDTDKQGHVTLTKLKNYVPTDQRALADAVAAQPGAVEESKKWGDIGVRRVVNDAMEKAASHTDAVNKARAGIGQQTSLV